MRTAAICPTCATYENAVCVIYNGPTLSNINVPPLTDLQTALGSINASIGSVIALINSVAANPISLTTTGTSGPATLTGNALNVPNYQPTFQNVITNGNQLTSGLVFSTTGNTNIATVNNINLTANRNYELPDTAGTLALASDITLQNVTAGTNKNLTNGINLQGTGAGDNNTGTQDINAFGLDAAKNNSGVIVNAFGRRAAENNTGNNVVAFGIDSASDNTGDYVNSIGSTCLTNNTGSYVNAIGLGSGNNNSYSYINLFGFGATASANNQVVFSKDAGGEVARIGYGGITSNRLYTLPNASGELVISVNGVTPVNGDVTISTGLPYLVYSALVKFSLGSISLIQLLQNTTGATITLSTASGLTKATASSSVFTNNKTVFIGTSFVGLGLYNVVGERTSGTIVSFNAYDVSNQTITIENDISFFIEIRVYP